MHCERDFNDEVLYQVGDSKYVFIWMKLGQIGGLAKMYINPFWKNKKCRHQFIASMWSNCPRAHVMLSHALRSIENMRLYPLQSLPRHITPHHTRHSTVKKNGFDRGYCYYVSTSTCVHVNWVISFSTSHRNHFQCHKRRVNWMGWHGVMLKPWTIVYWNARRATRTRAHRTISFKWQIFILFGDRHATHMHLNAGIRNDTLEWKKRARRKNENNKLFKIITFFSDPFYFRCSAMIHHTQTHTMFIIVCFQPPLFFVSMRDTQIQHGTCVWAQLWLSMPLFSTWNLYISKRQGIGIGSHGTSWHTSEKESMGTHTFCLNS